MQNQHVKGPDHPTPFAMGTAEHDSTAGGMFLSGAARVCSSVITDTTAPPAQSFMSAPEGWKAEKISVDLHLPDGINVYSTSEALGGTNFYSQLVPPVLLDSAAADNQQQPAQQQQKQKRVFSEADFALEYVPHEEWGGRREGFVFRLGAQGMGYYRDTYQPEQWKLQNTGTDSS